MASRTRRRAADGNVSAWKGELSPPPQKVRRLPVLASDREREASRRRALFIARGAEARWRNKHRAEQAPCRIDKEAFRLALIAKPTPAEAALRAELTAHGIRHDFQPLIAGYIPDFHIMPGRILVELDGGVHGTKRQRVYDAQRTGHLGARGWRVLRFDNAAVLADPSAVRSAITAARA